MKTAVTLPVETYSGLLGRCLLTSREYAILRNGVVSRGFKNNRAVRILCEAEDAELVYSLADRFYPAAVLYISKNVDLYNSAEQESARTGYVVNNSFDFQGTGNEVFWGEIFPSEHFVQIYDDDSGFMDTLEEFIKAGLQANDGVIVIATPAHLRALETRLERHGLGLNELRAQDRYIGLEAEQVLERFMVNGWPMTRVLSRLLLVLSSGQEARGEKCGHLVKWSPYSGRAEIKGLLCVWSIFGIASAKPIRFLFSAHTRGLALPGIFQSQSEKSVPRTR